MHALLSTSSVFAAGTSSSPKATSQKKKSSVGTKQASPSKKQTPSLSTNSPNSSYRLGYAGDINLRLELGTRAFNSSIIDGTFVSETIGRDSFELLFSPEYGFYTGQQTVLVVSLPMRLEIDFIAGAFFSLQLSFGLRRYFLSILFAEVQVAVDILSQNQFAFRFAGLNPAFGVAIPVWGQFQLYAFARFPIRFWPYFGFAIDTGLGLQILF